MQLKSKPLPRPNEFKEFYQSIQVVTSQRPVINKTFSKNVVRNSSYGRQ